MKKIFIIIFSFLLISFSYSLKITEVYFDWSDEFIWIYNEWNDQFSWNLIIAWVKSSDINLNIQINSQQEVIIWDDGSMLSWLKLNYSGVKLSISDTKSMNIKLLSWNNILDTFYVWTSDVQKINNKKTSFEKIYSGWVWLVQAVQEPVNVKPWYFANPGFVDVWNLYSQNEDGDTTWWNQNTWNSAVQTKVLNCNIVLNNVSWWIYNFSYSWDFFSSWINWYQNNIFFSSEQNLSIWLTWENNLIQWVWIDLSWNICTGNFFLKKEVKNINIFTWTLQINEIHPNKDGNFNEYVELKAVWNISGDYLFSWFSSSSHTFNSKLVLYSWNIIVFAKSYSWFKYTWNVILQNLSLKDNWENLQIITSGQVIDNVDYSKWNYLYFTENSWWIKLFNTRWEKTPWYENYVKKYYPKQETVNCSIVKQSQQQIWNQLKINLDSEISDNKYCWDTYRQIWTYSWWIITWTCNPWFIYLNTWDNNINFQIRNLSWDNLCEDSYKITYLQKQENTKNKQLNCYIKIQSKDDYFLSNSSINFITVVNDQEIQNSNTHYVCRYSLSWQVLSNECNPSSLIFSWWLHKINLSITWDDDKTCQTVYYLNLPNENTKIVSDTYKEPINSTNCLTMNSSNLKLLVDNVLVKYKSDTTLKKIFGSIKFLFVNKDNDFVKKSNSNKLRQFVQEIDNKYKSDTTLKKIFKPISYLYKKESLWTWINIETGNYLNTWFLLQTWEKLQTFWSTKIVWILPNPIGADKWREVILLSWNIQSWLYLQIRQKKYKLSKYSLSWNNYLFTWTFNLLNTSACMNLFNSWNILQDRKCYKNPEVWKYIYNFTNRVILNKKKIWNLKWLKLYFSWVNIIVRLWEGQKIFKNKPYRILFKKVKKIIKIVKQYFDKSLRKNRKLQNRNNKLYYIYLKYYAKYLILKNRYNLLKNNFIKYKKHNKRKYKNKILTINIYKKQISFLKKYLSENKKLIDYKKYQRYLKDYKKLIKKNGILKGLKKKR